MGIINSLPIPSPGPFKVGTIDLEVAVPRKTFGSALLVTTSEPALILETSLFTIYYPSTEKNRTHGVWLERPLGRTLNGYFKFSRISETWRVLAFPFAYILAGSIKLQSSVGVPLATELKDAGSATSSLNSLSKAIVPSFPIVIFSHGLSGTKSTYSTYCSNLASNGHIVVAIEHRDGTGPITVINTLTDGNRRERIVEYLRMEDLKFEEGKVLTEDEFRKEQLLMREAEVEASYEIMELLSEGEKLVNLRDSKGNLSLFKDRIDFSKAIIAGHSFGGATAIQILRNPSNPYISSILLDPYVDQVPKHSPTLIISKPVLVINSEIFTLWSNHFVKVRDIVLAVKGGESWLITLVGSIHTQFSDLNLLSNYAAKKSGARVDSKVAMDLFTQASLEFIRGKPGATLNHPSNPIDFVGRRPGEGYPREGLHLMPVEEVGDLRYNVSPVVL